MVSFTIHSWMITELKLNGNDLLVYAIVYHFSSMKGNYFTASLDTLCKTLNISLSTAQRVLKKLMDMNLITKEDVIVNNVRFCRYSIIKFMQNTPSQNDSSIVKMTEYPSQNDYTPSQNDQQEYNNIKNNNITILQTNKSNNIDINNTRRGSLFAIEKREQKKAEKYSRMCNILDAFLVQHKLSTLKNLFLDYLAVRIKKGLEPEQWAKILEPLKNLDLVTIKNKLNTAIAAGYMVLVPEWELSKKSKRVDNIIDSNDDDVDYTPSGMVF